MKIKEIQLTPRQLLAFSIKELADGGTPPVIIVGGQHWQVKSVQPLARVPEVILGQLANGNIFHLMVDQITGIQYRLDGTQP